MGGNKQPLKRLAEPPVWRGPEEDGITQSLLSTFLVCRERFRLLTIKGLREREGFSFRLEYGNMWHVCEEYHARGGNWQKALLEYCSRLAIDWPDDRRTIDKWYSVCKRQFPAYVDYWSTHAWVKNRKPLLQEATFRVPYELPSGRMVTLRGKWDGVDLVGKGIYLQENKAKGDVYPERLVQELPFDLQTMVYLTALTTHQRIRKEQYPELGKLASPVRGVLYNVIRRPLSGGKHSISQHKGRKTKQGIKGAETTEQFYDRLGQLIRDNGDYFFYRFKVEITRGDIERFQRECLNPILEQLWDWWEDVSAAPDDPFDYHPGHRAAHFRLPYGIWNPILQGRSGDYDDYLLNGNTAMLERVPSLFRELEEVE